MSEEPHAHEALIIKRGGGGHHDEHHGGVWKIAFADFMTAMMAFFLVMWLISANDKTKATIAKYFNPIELVDSTPQPVGLNDSKKEDPNVQRKSTAPPEAEAKDARPTDKEAAPPSPPKPAPPLPVDIPPIDDAAQTAKHDETELIRDPYAVIEEIAAKASIDPPKQAVAAKAEHPAGGVGAAGLKVGEAFRDPFEPQPIAPGGPLGTPDVPLPQGAPATPPAAPSPADAGKAGAAKADTAADAAAGAAMGDKSGPGTAAGAQATPGVAAAAAAASADKGDDKPLAPAALRARIAALVKASDGGGGGGVPKVEVRRTDEGTLVSLTDSADFSMFASASARPSPKAVALMEKIGRLLKSQKGDVTIRGFTDSRPFRSDVYDNWRLSTERAHIAQYMLVRGGLDDTRIDRVEGYADRRPKLPKDPEAAENRRIEILLRNPAP